MEHGSLIYTSQTELGRGRSAFGKHQLEPHITRDTARCCHTEDMHERQPSFLLPGRRQGIHCTQRQRPTVQSIRATDTDARGQPFAQGVQYNSSLSSEMQYVRGIRRARISANFNRVALRIMPLRYFLSQTTQPYQVAAIWLLSHGSTPR